MEKEEIFKILYDKEILEVYRKFQEIENSIDTSNYLYKYVDDIINMLKSDKSYIKVRGFRLICRLSKYDVNNIINLNVNLLLNVLKDDKPTNVRQCLNSLNYLLFYKRELLDVVKHEILMLDLSKYKDTMRPLIEKDMQIILNNKGDLL